MNDLDLLLKAKANSIGYNKKEKLVKKTKEITKNTLAVLMLSAIALGTCACSNAQTSNVNYYQVNEYEQSQTFVLEYTMKENNIEFYQANNTVNEYRQIQDILTEDNIIIYYDQLGEEECNKILVVLGYENLNDYLIKKGYVDGKGQPDVSLLRSDTYQRITKEMAEKTK